MTITTIRNADGILETIDDSPQLSPSERKRIGAKCGHIKRRLIRNEPLTEEQLEFAVSIAGQDSDIAKKLKAGQPLSEYELYLMVDVFLVN